MIGGFVSAPVPLSFQKSFGFGDRLGSATTVDGNIPSPNGAQGDSPGQRPGITAKIEPRPEGAEPIGHHIREPPMRAYPGRCPGLSQGAPLGLGNDGSSGCSAT
jgi:hypothetical protein